MPAAWTKYFLNSQELLKEQPIKLLNMKQFLAFVHKEFLHAFRDKRTLLIMFGLPLMQILIFGYALTNELKNAKILVADYANDEVSRDIIHRIEASSYFDIEAASTD